MTTETKKIDQHDLERRVKEMYTDVAKDPSGEFHFQMGRGLAESLGYEPAELDQIPAQSIESFAGVGYYFDIAEIGPGDQIVDLGSGSGMDVFIAALRTGPEGKVTGVDMTDAQLDKSRQLATAAGFDNVEFVEGHIEELPSADGSIDVVISNGVINLSPFKDQVFAEVARVLKPGGRLAFADIVTSTQLPEGITCDASLWAACIGGAMQLDACKAAIEAAGLVIKETRVNEQYGFISDQAQGATQKYGVHSVSIVAIKP